MQLMVHGVALTQLTFMLPAMQLSRHDGYESIQLLAEPLCQSGSETINVI